MLVRDFRDAFKTTLARFNAQSSPSEVRVDRDRLRTTLLQCEHEVREMHRVLNSQPALPAHRKPHPGCRYQ